MSSAVSKVPCSPASCLTLTAALRGRNCCCPQLIDEDTEATIHTQVVWLQGSWVSCYFMPLLIQEGSDG